jgi:hypothetical protein
MLLAMLEPDELERVVMVPPWRDTGDGCGHRCARSLEGIRHRSLESVWVYTGQLKTKVPRLETCWWTVRAGFIDIKTKGTCVRDDWSTHDVRGASRLFRSLRLSFPFP